jgi:putative FmdB family regulatory protein
VAVVETLPGASPVPMYNFKCPQCRSQVRILRKVEKAADPVECPHCKVGMERAPMPPTSMVKEVLDNGLMSRKVERLANAEEIGRDRSKTKEDREP